jgi:hypothetical protein
MLCKLICWLRFTFDNWHCLNFVLSQLKALYIDSYGQQDHGYLSLSRVPFCIFETVSRHLDAISGTTMLIRYLYPSIISYQIGIFHVCTVPQRHDIDVKRICNQRKFP